MTRPGSSPPSVCTCGHSASEHLMSYGMCAECTCYRFDPDADR